MIGWYAYAREEVQNVAVVGLERRSPARMDAGREFEDHFKRRQYPKLAKVEHRTVEEQRKWCRVENFAVEMLEGGGETAAGVGEPQCG